MQQMTAAAVAREKAKLFMQFQKLGAHGKDADTSEDTLSTDEYEELKTLRQR